jgi:Mn-dependent DtxR family transcriptional regulator
MAERHSIDEYLETIYFLAFPIGEYSPQATGSSSPTLASRVAEMLGVSRASAGEMLKRLEKEGLIRRGEHKEALLTPAGRKRAEKVVRKHRIVERLLTDFMGYTAAEAHVYADDIGETLRSRRLPRPRSVGWQSTTATSCTGSTTRASSRGRRSSSETHSRRRASSPFAATERIRRSAKRPPPASS